MKPASRLSRLGPLLTLLLVIAAPGTLVAQTASLVDDLQPFGETNPSSETRFLARIGQRAVFEAFRLGVGYQLWSTDGTAQGTEVMPMFVGPKVVGALRDLSVVVDEFPDVVPDTVPPRGLYFSDGTAAGTRTLLPLVFRLVAAADQVAGDRFYFFGSAADEGQALWWTDGSSAGGRKVAALPPGEIRSAKVAGDRLFFLASDQPFPNGCLSGDPPPACQDLMTWRLWTSDGTARGTRALEIVGASRPYEAPLTLHGAQGDGVYVSVRRPSPAERVLYFSRGTSATTEPLAVYRVDEQLEGLPALSAHFTVLSGKAVFYALSRDAGAEVWTSDGTAQGTRRITDLAAEQAVSTLFSPPPALVTDTGRWVFLAAGDGLGLQLWSSDGRPGSTSRLTTLPGFPSQGLTEIHAPVAFDGRVFFTARGVDSGLDLWVTDGSVAGTRVFFESGFGGVVSVNPTADGNQLFFGAADPGQEGEPGQGGKLWHLQVDAARAAAMTPNADFDPSTLFRLNGIRLGFFFVFAADDGQHGTEPWIAGFSGNARLLTDLEPGEGPSSNPVGLTRFGDRALFFACQGEDLVLLVTSGRSSETRRLHTLGHDCTTLANEWRFAPPPIAVMGGLAFHAAGVDRQLWRTDGTPDGTFAVTDFVPPPNVVPDIRGPVVVGSKVVFAVHGGFNFETRESTWTFGDSDGSLEGTRLLFTRRNDRHHLELFGGEDRWYFQEQDRATGRPSFWVSNGTLEGTQLLAHGAPRSAGPTPRALAALATAPTVTRFGGLDYFRFDGELRRTDGTPEGTETLSSPFSNFPEDEVLSLSLWRDALYIFTRSQSTGSRELWRTNGTAEGTERLLALGSSSSQPNLVPLGDQLYWTAFTFSDLAGELFSLYRTDGTPEGSHRVEIGLGAQTHFTSELVAFEDRLYFPAFQSASADSAELWATDGTVAGTGVVQDLHPGPGSSEPAQLLALPDRLLFSANDGVIGRELWAVHAEGTGCVPSLLALCLRDGRVRAEVVYQDRGGAQHFATATPLTTEAGGFSFFRAGNLDLFVKVLDGSAVNGHGWVFVGSLSDAGFILTLTDTQTGAARRYTNLQGRFSSFADTAAFDFRGALAQGELELPRAAAVEGRLSLATNAGGPCLPATARLCLLDGRFSVEIDWIRPGASGEATMLPGSDSSGTFWFFRPENLEGAVKVIDGRPVNGRFWFFFTGLTNLELAITVTDTETGQSKTYSKPRGTFAAFGDTAGF